jgi:hypothetical protein
MEARGSGLFFILLLLTGASGAVLAAEDRRGHELPARAESFQRLVGGLGFGPALDLSECSFGFDPRLDGTCSTDYGPIPGGACFRSRQPGSIFFYPPLEHGTQLPAEEGGNALPP